MSDFLCSISHLVPNHLHSLPSLPPHPSHLLPHSSPSPPPLPSILALLPLPTSLLLSIHTSNSSILIVHSWAVEKPGPQEEGADASGLHSDLHWRGTVLACVHHSPWQQATPLFREHDTHIECIMALRPDMVMFIDYFTKVGVGVKWGRGCRGGRWRGEEGS